MILSPLDTVSHAIVTWNAVLITQKLFLWKDQKHRTHKTQTSILALSRHRFRMGLDKLETIAAGQVREASWEAFATVRNGARSDPFFAGCEAGHSLHSFSRTSPVSLKRDMFFLRCSHI